MTPYANALLDCAKKLSLIGTMPLCDPPTFTVPPARRPKSRRPILLIGSVIPLLVLTGLLAADESGISEKQRLADAAFFVGREYVTALKLYEEALHAEERPEVRECLQAMRIRCLTALGEQERAVRSFYALCRDNPERGHLEAAPIPWSPSSVPGALISPLEKLARDQLEQPDAGPTVSLLAAATLAGGISNDSRRRGMEELLRLSRPPQETEADRIGAAVERRALRINVARLATVLLWRHKMPTGREADDLKEVEARERFIRHLPEQLRAGAWWMLGESYDRIDRREQAVLAWMRVPILYSENRPLAAKALIESARALDKLGRREEGRSLLREVKRDYPDLHSLIVEADRLLGEMR